MNKDHRIYRRSTLLQLGIDEDVIDGLEVVDLPGGPDARFQLVRPGNLFMPACSLISRTIDDVWFLDTGVEVDGGRVYIGQVDFEGMARVCGFVSKASVARVDEENRKVKRDLAVALDLINVMRATIAQLVGAEVSTGASPRVVEDAADIREFEALGDKADSKNLDLAFDEP